MAQDKPLSPGHTIGLDVGDKRIDFCLLSQDGEVVQQGAFPTTQKALERTLSRYVGAKAILEVGSHSPWIRKSLLTIGYEDVLVAKPAVIRAAARGLRIKNDRLDAFVLAVLGRGFPRQLMEVEHRSDESRANLSLIKSRELLVGQRTQIVNAVRGKVKPFGVRLVGCTPPNFLKKAPPQIPEELRAACDPLFAVLSVIREQLLGIQRVLRQMTKRYPQTRVMMTVHGVGVLTALHFSLVVEDPHRVSRARNVGSYVGLAPRQYASGSSDPQLRITKAGDNSLRRNLVLAAHHILGPFGKDSGLRRWGLEICERGGSNGKKRAVIAVARKLAVLLLTLWRTGQDFDPSRGCQPAEVTIA